MIDCGIYHLFKTPIRSYVFDANRNALLPIDEDLYLFLKNKSEPNDIITKKIQALQEQGYLLPEYPQDLLHTPPSEVEYYLSNKISSVTLQLTQRCNFRCTYCIYSEDSSFYQREHSNSDMTIETAEAAIDFLFEHSRDVNHVSIGLYGGEPLLRFDLIRSIVKYVQQNYFGKKVTYSITTNGSLLTEEIVDFFVENNIYPMISFDGPQEIHDKYRHFASNGRGTYDTVLQRLNFIKTKYPSFFEKLKFSTVVDTQSNLKLINDELASYYKNHNISPRISLLSDSYDSPKTSAPENYIIVENDERIKTFLYTLGYVKNGNPSPIAVNLLDGVCKMAKSFTQEHSFKLQKAPGGPCIPGAVRLFINTEGVFFPCEHVSEKSEVMKIGNLSDGFDMEKVLSLLNVSKLTEKSCQNCWVYHHCYQCAKFCDTLTSLSPEKRLHECQFVKNAIENQIRHYLMLKEMMDYKNENQNLKECCRIPI